MPERVKLPLAVFLALLAHAMVVLLVWAWPFLVKLIARYSLLPSGCTATYVAPKPTPEPKKLEVVLFTPTPTPAPKLAAKPTPPPAELTKPEEQLLKELFAQLPPERQRDYVDVEGLARKKNVSKRALIESWRDSVAGSRKQGKGDDPLPSLDGLENMPFTHLTNREGSLGKPEDPAAAEMRNRTTPVPSPAGPVDDLPPLFKPKPVNPATQTADTTPETAEPAQQRPLPPATPTPQPMLVAKATPPPDLLRVVEASADQIPVFLNRPAEPDVPTHVTPLRPDPPDPTPKPTPQPTATPAPKPTPQPTAKPIQQPQSVIVAAKLDSKPNGPRPVPNPGYSPHMRRTKVDGGNLAPGDDGIDAVSTPVGRYKKAVSVAVDSRWQYLCKARASLIQVGTVQVAFSLDARGKVRGFRVEENTSNSAHAALIEQAVREAEFDPPPPEALRNGLFEYPMSFNLY